MGSKVWCMCIFSSHLVPLLRPASQQREQRVEGDVDDGEDEQHDEPLVLDDEGGGAKLAGEEDGNLVEGVNQDLPIGH